MDNKLFLNVLILLLTSDFEHVFGQETRYAVLIDAGSSGSRVRVYKWSANQQSKSLPDIDEVTNLKTEPGMSDYVDKPNELDGHLMPLLAKAKATVPENLQTKTPLYIMATAGMRLLETDAQNQLFNLAHQLFLNKSACPFNYEKQNGRILSGEEEAAFSWITVNYIKNRAFFDKDSSTGNGYGMLEMGGASLQVAFIPSDQILSELFPLTINGNRFSLYTQSYLALGQNYWAQRVREYVAKTEAPVVEKDGYRVVENPCLLTGDSINTTVTGNFTIVRGSSNGAECIPILRDVFARGRAAVCYPAPCPVDSVYQPEISTDMTFYAVSAFAHTSQALKADDNGVLNIKTLNDNAMSTCSKNLTYYLAETNQPYQYGRDDCIIGLYVSMFLTDLGFKEGDSNIIATTKINGENLEWTLGGLLYEMEYLREDGSSARAADSGSSSVMLTKGMMYFLIIFSQIVKYL